MSFTKKRPIGAVPLKISGHLTVIMVAINVPVFLRTGRTVVHRQKVVTFIPFDWAIQGNCAIIQGFLIPTAMGDIYGSIL
jgi:hypothetical protein